MLAHVYFFYTNMTTEYNNMFKKKYSDTFSTLKTVSDTFKNIEKTTRYKTLSIARFP